MNCSCLHYFLFSNAHLTRPLLFRYSVIPLFRIPRFTVSPEEHRQTENLAKQREELVSRQGQLQSQLQKERTQNERMKEKYLILRQQVEEMSKHKTTFKCLGCNAINAHVTVTSRNALQLLSRDSSTCRYHRHLTEFVRKRMPLITVTHSPEAISGSHHSASYLESNSTHHTVTKNSSHL